MGNWGRDNRGGSRDGGRSFGGRNSGSRSFDRGGGRGDRQMHQTTCSDCGKDCEVPFRPTSGKPVYCSNCFENKGDRRPDSRPQRDGDRNQGSDKHKAVFNALNEKLDKILKILEQKPSKVVVPEKIVKEVKKTKTETKKVKVKKTKTSKTKKTTSAKEK